MHIEIIFVFGDGRMVASFMSASGGPIVIVIGLYRRNLPDLNRDLEMDLVQSVPTCNWVCVWTFDRRDSYTVTGSKRDFTVAKR